MTRGMLGRKVGMTQIFEESGAQVSVTVIEVPENRVLQVKNPETDGYNALKLGVDAKKEKACTRAEIGAQKAGGGPCRFVKELRLGADETPGVEQGGTLKVGEVFDGVEKLKVIGISKGKGFAGVLKRHNFGGFRATHGVRTHHRHAGSIGQCADPGRVFKGKKMPGHMGSAPVTQRGMKLVRIDAEKNLVLVRGSVPGANGSYVMLCEDRGYVPPSRKN